MVTCFRKEHGLCRQFMPCIETRQFTQNLTSLSLNGSWMIPKRCCRPQMGESRSGTSLYLALEDESVRAFTWYSYKQHNCYGFVLLNALCRLRCKCLTFWHVCLLIARWNHLQAVLCQIWMIFVAPDSPPRHLLMSCVSYVDQMPCCPCPNNT